MILSQNLLRSILLSGPNLFLVRVGLGLENYYPDKMILVLKDYFCMAIIGLQRLSICG